jgi:hypothetical protein
MSRQTIDQNRQRPRLMLGIAVIALLALQDAANAHPLLPRAEPQILAGLRHAAMHEMGKGGGMGMMNMMGGMGSMGGGQAGAGSGGAMPGMGRGAAGGMGMMEGMGMMGRAPGAGTSMAMPSALPGFPGASHIYHVGATGLFLDHADAIGLSVEQKTALNALKQRTAVEQAAAQRKVDDAEQALWLLTAAEQPDAAAIEAKLREIERLKSEMRLAYIRAVGEAARALNDDQRKMVLGMVPMPGKPAGH